MRRRGVGMMQLRWMRLPLALERRKKKKGTMMMLEA